jgi:hypothetical protein
LVGKPKEINHLEDLDVDGRILKYISKRYDGRAWTGLIWLRIKTNGRPVLNKVMNIGVP